jgi:hypothetical protein
MIFYGIELAIGTDVKSLVVEGGTALPTTNLAAGRLFYNTTSHTLYFYNGSAWTIIGGGTQGTFVTAFNNRTGAVTLLAADLPIATAAAVGGIRVGAGLAINGSVLSATAPAPVTEIPNGSRLLWAQSIAPTGWTQVTDITANNRLLRVVNVYQGSQGSGGTGGNAYGGTDNPIMNDKIINHAHHFDVNSGDTNTDHTHVIKMNVGSTDTVNNSGLRVGDYTTEGAGSSRAWSEGMSANAAHHHNVAGDSWGVTVTSNYPDVGPWYPQYLNLILCRKGV